jgi:hypothetical protein
VLYEIRFRWRLWCLQRERRKAFAKHQHAIEVAERKTCPVDEGELEPLYIAQQEALEGFDAKLAYLTTRYLIEKAEQHSIPYPEYNARDGSWVLHSSTMQYSLSVFEIAKLRSALRQEYKERSEYWRLWATLLLGLMGMVIGLVAVLKR